MFRDRQDAAERLADALAPYAGRHPLILAIPRGAVPMAHILAERLGGPKWQRELARMIETGEKKGKLVLVGGGK